MSTAGPVRSERGRGIPPPPSIRPYYALFGIFVRDGIDADATSRVWISMRSTEALACRDTRADPSPGASHWRNRRFTRNRRRRPGSRMATEVRGASMRHDRGGAPRRNTFRGASVSAAAGAIAARKMAPISADEGERRDFRKRIHIMRNTTVRMHFRYPESGQCRPVSQPAVARTGILPLLPCPASWPGA